MPVIRVSVRHKGILYCIDCTVDHFEVKPAHWSSHSRGASRPEKPMALGASSQSEKFSSRRRRTGVAGATRWTPWGAPDGTPPAATLAWNTTAIPDEPAVRACHDRTRHRAALQLWSRGAPALFLFPPVHVHDVYLFCALPLFAPARHTVFWFSWVDLVPLPLVRSPPPSTAVFAIGAMSFETGAYQNAVAMMNPAGAPHPAPGDSTFPVRVRPAEAVFLIKLTDSCGIPNALVIEVKLSAVLQRSCWVLLLWGFGRLEGSASSQVS